MKIAICARTWDEPGGIGVYTRNLVSQLIRLDRQNRYVLFYTNPSLIGQLSHYDNVDEIHVPSHKNILGTQIATLIWDQVFVPWYARKHDVDVIFHAKFAVPLVTKRKTVMVLHGTERFFYPQFSNTGDMLFFRTVYPYYLRRASAIIAVSNRAREDIINQLNIDPSKVTTVHLAISPGFRKINDAKTLDAVRKKYELPNRFILHVGHIYPGKNFGRLLRAFARIREHMDIKLVNVGAPRRKYTGDLTLIRELQLEPHVQLAGYVPHEEIVAFYNLAEVVVFPSIYESFGLPVLEAQACGCPLVTSNSGGIPEVAREAAMYVDPTNVEEIAQRTLETLTNKTLRANLVRRGFQNVMQFSWEKTSMKTLKVLESLSL
jgi:O-antigen biosynthesis alpha-1,2-mannosyltransferase